MDNISTKNKRILIIVMCAAIICFMGIFSYAFFTANVDNTKPAEAQLTTGTMALTFKDNDSTINEKLMFGESVTKKFTIENTGTLDTSLSLDWYDLVNTYTLGSLTYKLEYSDTEDGEYQTIVDTTNVPVTSEAFTLPVTSEISVPAGTTYYYNLIITLENLPTVDQSDDVDAIFHTKFTVDQPSKYRYYTLVVDPGDGTWDSMTGVQSYQLMNNETIDMPEPTRAGYTFQGWSITSVAGNLLNGTYSMGISNAKLVANWEVNKYTLTIDPTGGTYSGDASVELEYNTSTEIGTPTREGYTFTGWTVSSGNLSGNTYTIGADNATLTATWQVNNYKYIVYHYQQSIDGSEYTLVSADTDEGEAAYNTTVTPDRKTYTGFTSPSGKTLTIKAETTYPPVLNKVDYEYARNKYTLTVDVGTGTYTGDTIPSDGIYYQSSVNLGEPTKTGYSFSNWSATNGTIIDNTYTMSSAINDTVKANYTPNEYAITFNANGGTVDTQSKTVTYDSTYGTLPTPTYKTNYVTFVGWYTEASGGTQVTSTTQVNITENTTIYAHWAVTNPGTAATLAALNITVNEGTPDFSTVATTDEGVYALEDNYGTSYYYRGAVENNYVKFAGFYWRIIRVNGDGSIRMLYDGTVAHENGEFNSDRFALSGVEWNTTNAEDVKYLGYMYGGINGVVSTSKVEAQTNKTSSNIKTQLEEWYTTNIETPGYEKYLADIIFCNDRSTASEANSWYSGDTTLGFGTNVTVYGGFNRFITISSNIPSFICPSNNVVSSNNDWFTAEVTTANKGNGALDQPVGLITSDEIIAAGGKYGVANSDYYLYKGHRYWSMSPAFMSGDGYSDVFINYTDGSLSNYRVQIHCGVVPVVNLNTETAATLIGDGTIGNEYRLPDTEA